MLQKPGPLTICKCNASVLPNLEMFLAKETSLVMRSSLSSTDLSRYICVMAETTQQGLTNGKRSRFQLGPALTTIETYGFGYF